MQVVILAAGFGTRLRPLTYKKAKAMVTIYGKPFLEYVLGPLKRNNLHEVILCVGYFGQQIKDYFGDGRRFGVHIKYSFEEEKELLGTGGALKNAEHLLNYEFIVMFGDTFLNIDYQDLISYFHRKNKAGIVVVYKEDVKTTQNNVEVNEKAEIVNYNKRQEANANYIDAGVMVFKKDILTLIPPNKKVSLEEEIYPVLIKKKELLAYATAEKFYDIGTFERVKEFSKYLFSFDGYGNNND